MVTILFIKKSDRTVQPSCVYHESASVLFQTDKKDKEFWLNWTLIPALRSDEDVTDSPIDTAMQYSRLDPTLIFSCILFGDIFVEQFCLLGPR